MAGISRTQVQNINVANVFNYKVVIDFGASALGREQRAILAKSGFDKFMPAITANVPVGSIASEKFEFLVPLAVATGKGNPTMSVVFIDDKSHSIRSFFQHWVNDVIIDDGLVVKYLKEYTRDLTIIKYGERDVKAYEDVFTVFPVGDFIEQYDSSSNAPYTITVNFEIVGRRTK